MHFPWRPHMPHLAVHKAAPKRRQHDMLFLYQHEQGMLFICANCGRIAQDYFDAKHMAHLECVPAEAHDALDS